MILDALANYLEVEGKPFKLRKAWEELKNHPKWNDSNSEKTNQALNNGHNSSEVVFADGMERPIGNKKAKKERSNSLQVDSGLQRLAAATELLAKNFAATSKKSAALKEMSEYRKNAQFKLALGDAEGAKQAMQMADNIALALQTAHTASVPSVVETRTTPQSALTCSNNLDNNLEKNNSEQEQFSDEG